MTTEPPLGNFPHLTSNSGPLKELNGTVEGHCKYFYIIATTLDHFWKRENPISQAPYTNL